MRKGKDNVLFGGEEGLLIFLGRATTPTFVKRRPTIAGEAGSITLEQKALRRFLMDRHGTTLCNFVASRFAAALKIGCEHHFSKMSRASSGVLRKEQIYSRIKKKKKKRKEKQEEKKRRRKKRGVGVSGGRH